MEFRNIQEKLENVNAKPFCFIIKSEENLGIEKECDLLNPYLLKVLLSIPFNKSTWLYLSFVISDTVTSVINWFIRSIFHVKHQFCHSWCSRYHYQTTNFLSLQVQEIVRNILISAQTCNTAYLVTSIYHRFYGTSFVKTSEASYKTS